MDGRLALVAVKVHIPLDPQLAAEDHKHVLHCVYCKPSRSSLLRTGTRLTASGPSTKQKHTY